MRNTNKRVPSSASKWLLIYWYQETASWFSWGSIFITHVWSHCFIWELEIALNSKPIGPMADMWIWHQKRGSIVGFVVSSHLQLNVILCLSHFLLLRNDYLQLNCTGSKHWLATHLCLDIITPEKNCKGKMVIWWMLIYFLIETASLIQ